MAISSSGRDFGGVNVDPLAIFYMAFAVAWSVVIFAGVGWLVWNRDLPFIRMRNVPILLSSLLLFQLFLILTCLMYPLNGTFPCGLEFWLMSVILPLAIALFEAQNMQLYTTSIMQKQMTIREPGDWKKMAGLRGSRAESKEMRFIRRLRLGMIFVIGLSVVITLFVFLASRKFHDFGFASAPTTSSASSQIKCRQGWEWIPSTVWHFSWTFVFGPFIFFCVKGIDDVHYWKFQTILSILASLPGCPISLAALHSSSFNTLNSYWVPQMWFIPGIVVMQTLSLVFPLLDYYKSRKSHSWTLEAISDWEKGRQFDLDSLHTSESSAPSNHTSYPAASTRRFQRHSFEDLEKALKSNSGPLQRFAMTKDFSGENIMFLTDVQRFKDTWTSRLAAVSSESVAPAARGELFGQALEIYANYVSPCLSDMPINIDYSTRVALDRVFGSAAQVLRGDVSHNLVAPFDSPSLNAVPTAAEKKSFLDGLPASLLELSSRSRSLARGDLSKQMEQQQQQYSFDVPEVFAQSIFDKAEQQIKYMVFTNTWARFIESSSISRPSSEPLPEEELQKP